MYKLHLIFKYLRKRRIAWVSLIAVMLCTAMVLVVISVMGGWLRMFRETNHALAGDIVAYRLSLEGFPYYQEMIDKIQALPEVKAAAPQIHSYGLISIENIRVGVEVVGYDIRQISQVNGFAKSLHLNKEALLAMAADKDKDKEGVADAVALRDKAEKFPSWDKPLSNQTYKNQPLSSKVGDVTAWPGLIVGAGVIGLNPDDNGQIHRPAFMYHVHATLTVLNVSDSAGSGMNMDSTAPRNYWLIDDSRTGVFAVDQNTVYVPFDVLQKDLKMDPQPYTDATTGNAMNDPARTCEIQVGLKDGFDPNLVRPRIEEIVNSVVREHDLYFGKEDPIKVETWEQRQGGILSAVEHEEVLLVILFAMISVVAVFLIFCIFYMIVVEKTRDIGIMKSVGATGAGVAGIFLGYGLVIGLVGAAMGLLMGYLVVHNINWLHAQLAKKMGYHIWDAKTYVFDTIPNQLETRDVVVIVSVAILSSVLGAVVPAIRAARLSPVEALRWE